MTVNLQYMAPHEMCSLAAVVQGIVDTTYDANDLCDGDPHFEISRDGDLALSAIGPSIDGVNALVVSHHNLQQGTLVTFGGNIGVQTLIAPAIMPSGVRLNILKKFPPVTASSFTIAITGHPQRIVIGEVLVGVMREMRALPPESELSLVPIHVPAAGEYGGLDIHRGAAPVRQFGGRVYVSDATMHELELWFDGCKNNSLPSVIVPFPQRDPWVVKWTSFSPSPVAVDLGYEAAWAVDVGWQEIARFFYPVEP